MDPGRDRAPPGGPVDEMPPTLVESDPADRAVNAAGDQAIRLRFDEPIGLESARNASNLILVNPRTPSFDIRVEDETITLLPSKPMADGVTYMVTILPGLQGPADLRGLTERQLETLAAEIRETIISTVAETGGHLGSSLGVVELAIALHRLL